MMKSICSKEDKWMLNKRIHIKKKNILVVGDVMLDCYYSGSVKRISPEAPVSVFLKKNVKA